MIRRLAKFAAALACFTCLPAQGHHYDESKVPAYKLPDPLVAADNSEVRKAEQWPSRRAEIMELFREQMYGRVPQPEVQLRFEVHEEEKAALKGRAIRRQVRIRCRRGEREVVLNLLLYLPVDEVAKKTKVPVFLGLNFWGNQTTQPDPEIEISKNWVRSSKGRGNKDHRATEASRGKSTNRWPVELVLSRGYGLATIYYSDIDPDIHDGFKNGVHALFPRQKNTEHAPDAWGSIATWAWGLSRGLDYLETDEQVNGKRVVVVGHSRLGKTSLWAGASDQRFWMVVSNNSGCGGAALSRRRFGETVAIINRAFPHWFCGNFKAYNKHEDKLPLDQHMLVALMAPRPVLVCSAVKDRWADPRGEFLAAKNAAPVYRLLGTNGIGVETWPKPQELIKSRIGYYLRPGKHDMTSEDWTAYLDFADHHGLGVTKSPIR